jgi:rod shape-determining protein MreD
MAIIEGQIIGMSAGFVMGFVYDIVSGDILGTNALAKTVASFGAGYFHNVNLTRSTLTSLRFVMIVVLCSIAHNFLYFFFYIKPLETSFLAFFLQYGLGTSAYTAIFALVPILMRPRRG